MIKPHLKIKLFLDSAKLEDIERWRDDVDGFTTNPTLLKAAGVGSYLTAAQDILRLVGDKPISFEVIADDFAAMQRQAFVLHALGGNVYVKIPITNTRGESSEDLIRRLTDSGVKVNVTAVMTVPQMQTAIDALRSLRPFTPSILSIFAGRIADTGRNPAEHIADAVSMTKTYTQVLWASPREVLNVYQADALGCDIITLTPALLDKLALCGKSLGEYSLETVKMFYEDAQAAGLTL